MRLSLSGLISELVAEEGLNLCGGQLGLQLHPEFVNVLKTSHHHINELLTMTASSVKQLEIMGTLFRGTSSPQSSDILFKFKVFFQKIGVPAFIGFSASLGFDAKNFKV